MDYSSTRPAPAPRLFFTILRISHLLLYVWFYDPPQDKVTNLPMALDLTHKNETLSYDM